MEDIKAPTNEEIEQWSEGNTHLKHLLLSCRSSLVPSMYSCAGHGRKNPAYITLRMDKNTMPKIYNIMKSLQDKESISFLFSQKEYGKDPSFTVYMYKEKLRDSYMDIISESLTKEAKLDELPDSYKSIIRLSNIFRTNEIGYDLEYNNGKKRTLDISSLKFGNGAHLFEEDFKKLGFKCKKDPFNWLHYIKKLHSGVKEQTDLNSILDFVSKRYSHPQKNSFIEELHNMKKDVTVVSETSGLTKIKEKQKDVKEIG